MATVEDRINNWALEELRGDTQINMDVAVAWYNKGLQIFQKAILEYVSGKQNTSVTYANIKADTDEYPLPVFDSEEHVEDFYSIVQLRVAYHKTKAGNPIYRVCTPINFGDYNLAPALNTYKKHVLKNNSVSYEEESNWATDEDGNYEYEYVNEQVWNDKDEPLYELVERGGSQRGKPYVWEGVSEMNPRYIFVPTLNKDTGVYTNSIKIFPTPLEDIPRGLTLTFNFITQPVIPSTNESSLNLPRYFFDAIEDYMTFRLYQAENPEMAQWYYQQFQSTLNDNIYGLNKDKRPVEESFANTSYFSHY